jgi:hypothetical protein
MNVPSKLLIEFKEDRQGIEAVERGKGCPCSRESRYFLPGGNRSIMSRIVPRWRIKGAPKVERLVYAAAIILT